MNRKYWIRGYFFKISPKFVEKLLSKLYDEGMKAKPFILLISSSMFAAQSLAICSKVPEAYAETAYHFVTSTTNGTQTIAAGGSYI